MSCADSSEQHLTRRKRTRDQLSCDPCRQSKLKCGREHPICDQCCRRARQETCHYPEARSRYTKTGQRSKSMKEKLERLESYISSINDAQIRGQRSEEHGTIEIASGSGGASPNIDHEIAEARPKASWRWNAASNWQSIVHDIVDLKTYFELDQDLDNFEADMRVVSPPPSLTHESSFLFAQSPSADVQDLMRSLPSRLELNRYVTAFFSSGEPNTVIIHAPSFQQQYQQYWLKPEETNQTWLALLTSICSIGAEVLAQSACETMQQHADQFRIVTAQILAKSDTTMPQSHLIEALILHVLSHLFKHQDVTLQSWQLFGNVVRLCHQAGYHRDSGSASQVTVLEREMRRRIWMVTQELEIGMSCNAGMANFINPSLSDAKLPANVVDDEIFSTTQSVQARPRDDCTLVQIAICYWEMHSVLGRAATLSQQVVRPAELEIMVVCQSLEDVKAQLPVKLRWIAMSECVVDSPLYIAHRLRIEMAYLRAYGLLCLQSLRQPRSDSEYQLGEKCLSAALDIVDRSLDVLSATESGSHMAAGRALIARHIHDFNLAAMILCYQIKRMVTRHDTKSINGIEIDKLCSKLLQGCNYWDCMSNLSERSRFALRAIKNFLTSINHAYGSLESNLSTVPDNAILEEQNYTDCFLPDGKTATWYPEFNIDDTMQEFFSVLF